MTIHHDARERWRREVEREFVDDRAIAGWRNWYDETSDLFDGLTTVLLDSMNLEPGLRVLDIASGAGDPALSIAACVGMSGEVIASDISAPLLDITRERAQQRGLANLTCQEADAEALPFPDQSFDRVSCRLGLMYVLDPVAALKEMLRVVVPDGKLAMVVWGDPTHSTRAEPFFGPILRRITMPAPPPGTPNPYQFAKPGTVSSMLTDAGFHDVTEHAVMVTNTFPGPADECMQWFHELIIPMDYIWDALGPDATAEVTNEIIENLRPLEVDGRVQSTSEVIVVTGRRPPEG